MASALLISLLNFVVGGWVLGYAIFSPGHSADWRTAGFVLAAAMFGIGLWLMIHG